MDLIKDVLEAGNWAPSAKNGHQWRFTVLTGRSQERIQRNVKGDLG